MRFGGPRSGLAVMAVIIALLPLSFPNPYYYDIAVGAVFNAILCVGLNLLIGYAGQISLGHAGFFALGAYVSGILTTRWHVPPLAALGAGMVLVGLLAFVLARPILRLKGHTLAMATLGIGIIVNIVLATEAWLTGGPDGLTVDLFTLGPWTIRSDAQWYWVGGLVLLAAVWLAQNLINSPIGRALRAVHGAEVAAEVAGVDTTGYKVMVFVVSAVLASLVGSLFAHKSGLVTPGIGGFFRSIELVAMVVLGGMASTFGAVVGAVILSVLPHLLTSFEDYQPVVLGLIMMVTMIFMPKGMVPTLGRLLRQRRGTP
jgi:branched-chain amino acid transport system permease protein